MKRLFGPFLLIVLFVGVGAGIYFSVNQQLVQRQMVTVRGLIGSDKEDFFLDPRVISALHKGGVVVQYETAGSRTIANTSNLTPYDFVFSSGAPSTARIRQNQKQARTYDLFFTPMAIASWKPVAEILAANGIAKNQGSYYTLDMAAYLQLVADNKRWSDLKNNTAYNVNKDVLIVSTDVRTSNSAAMYLALASYVSNGNSVVQSGADVQKVLPLMEPLFLNQGFTEYSSAVPFEDYLSMGPGKSPLVMIYESQYLARAAVTNGLPSGSVLMYPQPTLYSKHTLIALTPNGQKLGQLLMNDPDLQRLAVEHGYHTGNTSLFQQNLKDHNLNLPDSLVNVVDPPSNEILEKMIQQIESMYQ